MSISRSSQLVAAMTGRKLVRIRRRFENCAICGYVVSVGQKFFLLSLVSDRIRFDGFECFRIADILDVEAHPYRDFVEAALKKRELRRPRKPKIDLDTVESILRSAGEAFPLIAIHQEKKNPDVCHIGQVCGVAGGKVSLRGITPHAKWEDQPDVFRLDQITRINFGGDYEIALHLVGGNAVQSAASDSDL